MYMGGVSKSHPDSFLASALGERFHKTHLFHVEACKEFSHRGLSPHWCTDLVCAGAD